ncbi:uncharacterized protein LAESUDRAFT_772396 [Laetiporus sulphureus 93-53]|uniref:Uncharacterized protein n=1 Tax=Laetiporus sulphureus 93-53 TaxID=1314785 RepID=A0A165EU97_9APHY|nr:uncharacterized protein LAESUDRAFT_772396 [Laetiporus sulphureus 93-53]KZT07775.1 hypothetical protein LAESUDRAFT_772396 [Laetiporus sulphureus 93-53]
MSLTASILKFYYPIVCVLREYLASILEPVDDGHEFLVNKDDPAAYRVLLDQSYVALCDTERRIKRVIASPPMVNVREIIEIAQERLLARGKDKTSNIITSGYRAVCMQLRMVCHSQHDVWLGETGRRATTDCKWTSGTYELLREHNGNCSPSSRVATALSKDRRGCYVSSLNRNIHICISTK